LYFNEILIKSLARSAVIARRFLGQFRLSTPER